MPKRRTDSGNPRDWMLFVKADMDTVRLLTRYKTAFFVCRSKLAEALEKTIKADLLARGWRLEKIQDLPKLCDYLSEYDRAQADQLQPLVDDLAESYTESRYPGFDLDEPDWSDFRRVAVQVKRYIQVVKRTRLPRPPKKRPG